MAGYHLYVGDSSGRYNDRIRVGDETTAQLVIDRSTLYLAVSAYTFEGFESVLSDELVVAADNVDAAASGRLQIISSSIQ
ncbi:MAG TPA: hypothetical protein VJ719_12380 [Chthoniobacterales bacterium]|nr:hypothetical protein [Chthoniobacterales bacterium]